MFELHVLRMEQTNNKWFILYLYLNYVLYLCIYFVLV